jgi:hypothetical protein
LNVTIPVFGLLDQPARDGLYVAGGLRGPWRAQRGWRHGQACIAKRRAFRIDDQAAQRPIAGQELCLTARTSLDLNGDGNINAAPFVMLRYLRQEPRYHRKGQPPQDAVFLSHQSRNRVILFPSTGWWLNAPRGDRILDVLH